VLSQEEEEEEYNTTLISLVRNLMMMRLQGGQSAVILEAVEREFVLWRISFSLAGHAAAAT
jgi:hypothetical protein